MNRRQLAKNGFLGLCGFLVAKFLPVEAVAEPMAIMEDSDTWTSCEPPSSGRYDVLVYDDDGVLVSQSTYHYDSPQP